MANIDTKGMKVADLNDEELEFLLNAEKNINKNNQREVYLLAVQR